MKKFLMMAVVAFGMLATACSKDEVAQPVAEKSTVTFSVSAPELATRALGDGTTATQLSWAVYDKSNTLLFQSSEVTVMSDLKATVEIPFVNGMAYNILFWAESENSPYSVNWEAKTVTYADGTKLANDESYDAFFCYYPVSVVTGPVTETVELKRPFAQLRIATNDTAAAALSGISVTDTKVTVAKTYTAFDFEDGDVTGETSTVEFAYNDAAKKAAGQIVVGGNTYDLLTVNYLFGYKGDKKLVDAKLTYKYGSKEVSADFSSVPIQQNYRTNIVGSLLTSEGKFNIEIKPGFDGEPGHNYEVVSVANAQELQDAVNNGASEIILENDIVLDAPIVFGTSTRAATANAYVLDLNGKELKGAVDNSLKGFVKNNGTLIVKNGTITSTLTNGAAAILNTGILTVENATLNGAPSNTATGRASYALNTEGVGSEVVLNNVNISGRGAVGATEGTKVEINGGTYHVPAVAWGHAIYAYGAGTEVTINGGIFTEGFEYAADLWGTYQIYSGNNAKVVVKGGDFSKTWDCANGYDLCTASGGTIEIFGGVFADNPASQNGKNYLATEDYEAVEENGVWKVVAKSAAIVTVNGVGYPSIKAAAKAAKKGEAVVLIDDMTLSEIMVLDLPIVFDGNGKTLTSTAGRAINVSGADGVTIKNLTINCSGERAINVIQNATNVTIENVTATAANYTVNVATSAPKAVVAIKNSTLDGLCTVNVSAAGAEVTVDGCTVNCNDNNTTVGEVYAAVSLNKEAVNGVIAVTKSTINVAEGSDSKIARNGAPNGTVTINGSTEGVSVMVAAVTYEGSAYYYSFETLEAAVEFAEEGDVITLLRSIIVEDELVIDLSDKNLTLKAEANFDMFIVKNGGELTLENGKFEAYSAIVQSLGGEVVINDGTFTQTGTAVGSTPGTYRYCIDCREGGEIIINGGTFKSNNGMINVGSTVTINGGKFENVVEKTMTRHFAYVSASLTINGGEFCGKANPSAGGCFFCGAAASCDILVNGGKFTSLWTSGKVNRIFESYKGGAAINVTGGLFNTNGGIANFVEANDDAATKDAYPYKAK